MKNKISIKTLILGLILILVIVLGVLGVNTAKTYLSGASADTEPKSVLAKAGEDGKNAVVTWTSDKESVGVVEYGTTPASLLLRAPESDQTTAHSVTLSPLKANTNYYFRIRVGEEVFDNNGIPYSFKTKAAVVTPTLIPTAVPTVGSSNDCGKTDLNKDGVINSLDFALCQKNKLSGTPAATTGTCSGTVDYDKNGTINSLDRLKCLQDNK